MRAAVGKSVLSYFRQRCWLSVGPQLKRIVFASDLTSCQRMSSYSIVERGCLYTPSYKAYFVGPSGFVSPFHDIPLYANPEKTVFNMIVEIPRWTNAKMEISRDDKLNPIKQDVKKGKVRFVDNCFPHHGYIWNYGAFPQTWEDPHHVDVNTGQIGDNDPIDVCEIGFKVFQRGEVVQVKVLGIIALIDEGETDWKVLAINVKDPLAENLNDICDVEKHMPGFLAMTRDWFRIYKMPTGKPANQFAFDGKPKDKKFALDIVGQTHEQWRQLVMKKTDGSSLVCENTTIKDSPFIIKQDAAKAIVDTNPISTAASAIPTEVDKWHFVK